MSTSDMLRVVMFEGDTYYDFEKQEVSTVADVKQRLSTLLTCDQSLVELVHHGRILKDEEDILLLHRVHGYEKPLNKNK